MEEGGGESGSMGRGVSACFHRLFGQRCVTDACKASGSSVCRDAIRSNSQRRNSCMDWRCNAARAAISSRTSSGTPLMVFGSGANALCHPKQCSERNLPCCPRAPGTWPLSNRRMGHSAKEIPGRILGEVNGVALQVSLQQEALQPAHQGGCPACQCAIRKMRALTALHRLATGQSGRWLLPVARRLPGRLLLPSSGRRSGHQWEDCSQSRLERSSPDSPSD